MRHVILNISLLLVIVTACHTTEKATWPKLDPGKHLVFDHTFTVHEKESDYFSMGKRGFKLMDKPVVHPGPVTCRFIKFLPEDYPFPQYLEWCHTPDFAAMKQRMKGKEDATEEQNGLGFRTNGDTEVIFKRLEPFFKPYSIYTFHKNFEWQKNNKDRLPGWDYIGLKAPIVPDLNFFGINYASINKKPDLTLHQHTNTAEKIMGVVLDLKPEEWDRAAQFTELTANNGVLSNGFGFHMIPFEKFKDRRPYLNHKKNNYKAVILKVKNVNSFTKAVKPDYEFQLYGQTFYGIKTPGMAWDILATNSEDFVNEIKRDAILFPLDEVNESLRIRKIYNSGKYKEAAGEANNYIKLKPNSFVARYMYAVLNGDYADSPENSDSEKQRLKQLAKDGVKAIYEDKDFARLPWHFRRRVRNEYYWFFEMHKDQYDLGIGEVAAGDPGGNYSATVGASMMCKKLLLSGDVAKAQEWAQKSIDHFIEYEKHFPDWHNINYFAAQSYVCLGQDKKADEVLLAMYKKGGNKVNKEEVAVTRKEHRDLRKARVRGEGK